MEDRKKNRYFSWRNVPQTAKAYPKTSVLFGILMAVAIGTFIYSASFGECFANFLMVLIFFPTYILAYVLIKYGKPIFLRLFWWLIPFYVIAIYILLSFNIRLIDSSAAMPHGNMGLQIISAVIHSLFVLLVYVLGSGIVFFLGADIPSETQKNETPWMMVCIAVPVAFICFFMFRAPLYNSTKTNVDYLYQCLTSKDVFECLRPTPITLPVPVDCSCIIWQDYDTVESEDGQKLKCAYLDRCDCGRFYRVCNDEQGKTYTGYAVYKDREKAIRKVYYENGKVNAENVSENAI